MTRRHDGALGWVSKIIMLINLIKTAWLSDEADSTYTVPGVVDSWRLVDHPQ